MHKYFLTLPHQILRFLFSGMAVGHVYYFLEDVFPYQRGGKRLLVTPLWLKSICDPAETEDPDYNPAPEERPGGFNWGGAAQEQENED